MDVEVRAGGLMQVESAFDVQVESLLSEVSVKVPGSVRDALVSIKTSLEKSKGTGPLDYAAALAYLERKQVSWPWAIETTKEVNYQFQYAPPARIDVVGSFLVGGEKKGGLVKRRSGFNVDLALEMPSNLFQPKDRFNHRYFHKRAFFLAVVAIHLRPRFPEMRYYYEGDDLRKPVLCISIPVKKSDKQVAEVVLRPAIASNVFRADALGPHRNNVRPDQPMELLPPTPAYNALLLSDMHMLHHLQTLHKAAGVVTALPEALKLLKVWCEQRSLNRWAFTLSYCAAGMALRGEVSKDFKPGHIFRMIMFFIANHDFSRPFGFMDDQAAIGEFTTSEVAIVDSNGVNLTAWASLTDAKWLQAEALKTTKLVEIGDFESMFLLPKFHATTLFDYLLEVPYPAKPPNFYNPKVRLDYPSLPLFLNRALPRLLSKAVSNRANLVCFVPGDPSTARATWGVDSAPPKTPLLETTALFGFKLNPAEYARRVDIGPSPDDAAACDEFHRLWGSKAELRRFPDGSIMEAVVWNKANPLRVLLDYVCERHIAVVPEHWSQRNAQRILASVSQATLDGEQRAHQDIDGAFRELSNLLSGLDLPLPIAAILPLSPELTRTAIALHRSPAVFSMELETSGKWPKEPKALYHMMTLFLLRMATLLEENQKDMKVHLVTSPLSLNMVFRGFLFQAVLKVGGTTSFAAELNHAMDMADLTLRHPGLGPAVRFFKLFVAKHMLGYQIHDHVAELLVAHAFTPERAAVESAPVDAMLGFIRALELIVQLNWKTSLFVKTRSEDAPKKAVSEEVVENKPKPVESPFKAPQEGMVLVMSPHKEHTVEIMAFRRLRQVAKAALKYLTTRSTSGKFRSLPPADLKPVLTTSMSYDMTIHLKRDAVASYVIRGRTLPCAALASALEEGSCAAALSGGGFAPVDLFIQDVTHQFGGILRAFFNDVDGGVIGLVVNPMQLVPRRWALSSSMVNARVLNDAFDAAAQQDEGDQSNQDDAMDTDPSLNRTNVLMQPNLEAIAEEIARIGRGLVHSIVISSPDLLSVGA